MPECGARRGALPDAVVEMLGTILERGAQPPAGRGGQCAARIGPCRRVPVAAPRPSGIAFPAPRTAAAAILAMLGSGVVIGSLANANVADLARTVLVAIAPAPAAVPPVAVADTGSGSGGTSGSSGNSGGGAGGSSPATSGASTAQPATTTTTSTTSSSTGGAGNTLPTIRHVFLIVLSDQGLNGTFGAGSKDAYLSKTLPRQGELIQNYYAVAGSALANEIALISGQGPTLQTAANCPTYTAITPATIASPVR